MGLNGRWERRRWGGRGAGPEQAGLAGPGLRSEPSRAPLEPQVWSLWLLGSQQRPWSLAFRTGLLRYLREKGRYRAATD